MSSTADGYRDGVALWAAATDRARTETTARGVPTAAHSFGSLSATAASPACSTTLTPRGVSKVAQPSSRATRPPWQGGDEPWTPAQGRRAAVSPRVIGLDAALLRPQREVVHLGRSPLRDGRRAARRDRRGADLHLLGRRHLPRAAPRPSQRRGGPCGSRPGREGARSSGRC